MPRRVLLLYGYGSLLLYAIDLVHVLYTRLYGCMGSIRPIHLYGKRYRRIFFTIEYEGVIIISIEVLRREVARQQLPNHFQS